MKLRSWAIVSFMLLVALGSALYEIKLYLEQKRHLEALVVQAVSPYVKGSFSVGTVRFGFFSAHLKNVSISLPAQALAISVDDFTLKLSPLRFIRTGFSVPRSVENIILVRPLLEYSLAPAAARDPATRAPPAAPGARGRSFGLQKLGIEYLLIKDGRLLLKDRTGASMILGEDLAGRMWDTETELLYELSGKLGATQKNLFVNGAVSWIGAKHRLSLRLRTAEIRRPISLKGGRLSSGVLSGALEFAFPDEFSLARLEGNGWIRIERGTCRIDRLERPLDSITLSLTLNTNRCLLDSLRLVYSCARVKATGRWNIALIDSLDRFDFECAPLCFDSVALPISNGVRKAITGRGWLTGTYFRLRGSDPFLSLCGGGIAAGGVPLTGFTAGVRLQKKLYTVDSLRLLSPGLNLGARGIIDNSSSPVGYSFACSGTVDSLSVLSPGLSGSARLSGTLQGLGQQANGDFTLSSPKVAAAKMPLGKVSLTVRVRDTAVSYSALGEDPDLSFVSRGRISGPFSAAPAARCTVSAVAGANHPLAAFLPSPDSLRMSALIDGWITAWSGHLCAAVYSRTVSGGLNAVVDRTADTAAPLVWNLQGQGLKMNKTPLACSGSGRLYRDSLAIDSLVLLDRTVTSGKIILTDPPQVNAVSRYRCPIRSLLELAGQKTDTLVRGFVSGTVRCYGPIDKIETRADIRVRDACIAGFGAMETDAILSGTGKDFTVLPLVVRKDGQMVLNVDTIRTTPHLKVSGRFDDLDIRAIFGPILPEEVTVAGRMTGSFRSTPQGLPIVLSFSSPAVTCNRWRIDSVVAAATIGPAGIGITELRAADGSRSQLTGMGYFPLAFFQGKEFGARDTLVIDLKVKGDLLRSLHHNLSEAVDGSGRGTVHFSLSGQPDNWQVREASLVIPRGKLLLQPYVPGDINNFSCVLSIMDSSRVSCVVSGNVRKRSFRFFSTHAVPAGYEPIVIGPLNFGILQIETPQKGLDIHLPGLMESGETGDLEPAGRKALRYFSIAGPIQRPTLAGTLMLRDVEFTYPMLKTGGNGNAGHKAGNEDPDTTDAKSRNPLSFVRWELDIKAANRKVLYFRNISSKNTRFMRFLEGYIDQGSSVLKIRGCDIEKNLKISGTIHSYHGAVYYGKTFDRNFQTDLEFVPQKNADNSGYDNLPILSGSVEAFADSSRFDRIKLTALVQDPKTGALSEKGRLSGKKLNVIFHLSADFEELPGESEREFYRQAGLQFSTLGGAGRFMSDFGEQYLHRFFLQRIERKLAKTMGLDVINIETSIASNYFNRFYNRQNDGLLLQADYLALANVGLTVGRYFFRDNLFVKARGGFLPVDTALTPQYSLGLEFQPTQYLFLDFDYGVYKGDIAIEHNPSLNLQLRLPITGLRRLFNF
jgi:hypothetical protein